MYHNIHGKHLTGKNVPGFLFLCFYMIKEEISMPRTKFQSVIFTLIMVFFMVYCMTVYTVAIGAGSLDYWVFLTAIKEMWIEYVIVFALIFFCISPIAVKLGQKYVSPKTNNPLFTTISIQAFTVMMIVPVITLVATFLHNGFTAAWFPQWIQTFAFCLPAAFFLQVCYVGPLVRFIFRHIFASQLKNMDTGKTVAAGKAVSAAGKAVSAQEA